MTIQVTQEDIDNGERSRCERCPIALAIQRATGARYSTVGITTAMISDAISLATVYGLPQIATTWLMRFDMSGPKMVQPFTFEMELAQ